MNKKTLFADFMLLLVAFFWGVTFLLVQDAIKQIPVFMFLFLRFALSFVLMALISYKSLMKINFKSAKNGVILGVFLFLGFAFQTFSLKYTYTSTVAFLTGLNVVIVPFLAFLIFKNKVKKSSIAGVLIASVGLYFLTQSGELKPGFGEFLAFLCAFMFAAQISFTEKMSKDSNVEVLVIFQFLSVFVFSLIASFIFHENYSFSNFSKEVLYALIITAVFATVFAFYVQTLMQRFTTSTKTAIIFTFEPVSAGIIGVYFVNETLSNLQIFGMFLIFLGILISETYNPIKEYISLKIPKKY